MCVSAAIKFWRRISKNALILNLMRMNVWNIHSRDINYYERTKKKTSLICLPRVSLYILLNHIFEKSFPYKKFGHTHTHTPLCMIDSDILPMSLYVPTRWLIIAFGKRFCARFGVRYSVDVASQIIRVGHRHSRVCQKRFSKRVEYIWNITCRL